MYPSVAFTDVQHRRNDPHLCAYKSHFVLKSTLLLLVSAFATIAAGLIGTLMAGMPGTVMGLGSGIALTFGVIATKAGR